jgi:hypothetical protein
VTQPTYPLPLYPFYYIFSFTQLPQRTQCLNNETRLITGPNIKYAPNVFSSVDKINKHQQTWQTFVLKCQMAMPKRAEQCGRGLLKKVKCHL